ncbi:MAG: putative porin [Paludibacteraceae bacterium]|nr:putative porin [Paludibacteraceae bacterium]
MKKLNITAIILLLTTSAIHGKENKTPKHLTLWNIDPTTGMVDSLDASDIDTSIINYHQRHNPVYERSIASSHLGNIGSPFQDKIYFNRDSQEEFIFLNPYSLYKTSIDEFILYNTSKPFADIQYTNGIGGTRQNENRIKGKFATNVNDKFCLGLQGDVIFGQGKYAEQSTRLMDFGVFTSYNGNRYSNHNIITFNNFKNYENGGIKDDRYITHPKSIESNKKIKTKEIPVNLTKNYNWIQGINLYTNHQYHLGKDLAIKNDSLNSDSITYTYVPIVTLSLSAEYGNYARKYSANQLSDWYQKDTSLLFKNKVNDPYQFENLKTSFSAILNEESSKTNFGSAIYIENEGRWYKGSENGDTSKLKREFQDDFIVGAKLFKKNDDFFHFYTDVNVVALGSSIGTTSAEGGIEFIVPLKDDYTLELGLDANFSYANQSALLDNYNSTYFEWNTPLDKEIVTGIQGSISIPDAGFNTFIGFENTKNKVFWNQQALPDQTNKNIQILQVSANESYEIAGFGFDVKATYQLSSDQTIVPLPSWSLYGNIYYTNTLFKLLTFQLGIDCYYNTTYFAPAYMPATGQFYNQQEVLIGNYPEINLYLNCQIKNARFYLAYINFNSGVFGGNTRFNVPHYPLNPGMFKFGISWTICH